VQQERRTGRGELDLAGGAPEAVRAEIALQRPHGTAQVRLRQVQPLGRVTEVQLLRDRHEDQQLLHIHPRPSIDALSTRVGRILVLDL
jgi:hypothetical protein